MQYTIEDLGHFYLQSIGLETYDHYSKKHIENIGWQVLESYEIGRASCRERV